MIWRRFFVILAAVCLLNTVSAAADKYGYAVDADTMKILEEQSACPVRVTGKKVVLECFDEKTFSNEGADALVITVTNRTESVITSVKVGFIALKEDGTTTDVTLNMTYEPRSAPEVKTLARSGLSLAPGESCDISARVDYERFKSVRAMVSEYETENGSVTVNPDYELWQMYAFGRGSAEATELD